MQTASAAAPAAAIPDAVQRVCRDGLTALWNAANEHASASLRAAQADWDAERAELETMGAQLAASFDTQTLELEAMRKTCEDLQNRLQACESKADDYSSRLDARNAENGLLRARMDTAGAITEELHNHVAELRRDLKQSQEKAARVERKLDEARQAAHAQALELKTELATRAANLEGATEQAVRAQLEREQALKSLSDAREQVGELRGRVEALIGQNADLLAAIAIK